MVIDCLYLLTKPLSCISLKIEFALHHILSVVEDKTASLIYFSLKAVLEYGCDLRILLHSFEFEAMICLPRSSIATITIIVVLFLKTCSLAEQWSQELDSEIGLSTTGYKSVSLSCDKDGFHIKLITPESFSGVLYTRGSFHKRQKPCFFDAKSGQEFSLNIPLDQCNVERSNNVFTTVFVVQHEDELIFPGDAAFKLVCEFASDGLAVERSEIQLADADPGGKEPSKDQEFRVSSATKSVMFTPADAVRPHWKGSISDEL